ncbi:Gfo/Idh/MocA family protein [Turneriella parva]|uniref:Oxidoreductase domain protein n=1 Tax=Turneriella parva (strain ATCC BAA-1111 / DSM 21527 / NCTC 11395 / H) TaxID=869212 RepID=I4BAJ3_TURPD|nr:Gfo/Idh/MocA family oxidoreductase [Turneriella parva]AFM14300.1 oxidoreductase domain protein [Turneriella parva DSM 21527]
MSTNSKIKFGIIGVGHMGSYHLNVAASLPTHEIVGIFDARPEHAAEKAALFNTRAFASYQQLIDACDAVTIAVPTVLHYEIAKYALEKGVHVLVEKPITFDLQQAEELIALAKQKSLVLQVGHVERFNGAVMALAKIVSDPLLIQTRRLHPQNNRILDVGVVLDLLIHDIDIVINLVNKPLLRHSAMGSCLTGKHEDIAVIELQFEGGCIATLTASRLSQYKERSLSVTQKHNFLILNYGAQEIEIHRQGNSVTVTAPDEIKYSQESVVERVFIHKDNPLKSEHVHFYNCIMGTEKPLVSGEADLKTLSIALDSVKQIVG